MIAELSHFALFVALIASGCQAVLPLYGSLNNSGGSALQRHLMGSAELFALVAAQVCCWPLPVWSGLLLFLIFRLRWWPAIRIPPSL